MTGRPIACSVARHRPKTAYQQHHPQHCRTKTAHLRERAAGQVTEYSRVDPVDQRRAIAVEAAARGWQSWELEATIGPLTEIEAAWFERNRRVTA